MRRAASTCFRTGPRRWQRFGSYETAISPNCATEGSPHEPWETRGSQGTAAGLVFQASGVEERTWQGRMALLGAVYELFRARISIISSYKAGVYIRVENKKNKRGDIVDKERTRYTIRFLKNFLM